MKSQKKVIKSDINKYASSLIKNRYVKLGVIVFSGIALFYIGGRICRLLGTAVVDYKTFIKQVNS